MTAETMTGGQALARQLVREGVQHVFGLPGDQTMHALDALYDEPSIRFITTRHEQGTTYLADGYARGGGRPGVAFVVPGVGVYNAGAGLATAFAASSPVVLIAGQINRDGIGQGLGLLHEIDDQLDLVRPITAWQRARPHRRRDPRNRARGVRPRAARTPSAGRDRDATGSVLGGSRRSRCCEPADDVRVAADPEQIARAAATRSPPPSARSSGPAAASCSATRPPNSPRWPSSCRRRSSPRARARARSTTATRSPRARCGSTAACSRCSTTPTSILAVGTHFLGNKLAPRDRRRAHRRRPRRDRPALRRPARGRRRRRADARTAARRAAATARSGTQPGRRDPGFPQAGRRRPARRRPPGPDGRPAPGRDPRRTACSCRAPRRSGT